MPTRLGVPLTVGIPLGVIDSCVVGVARVFGRAFRLRLSRSFNAFCIFVSSNASNFGKKDLIGTPHLHSASQYSKFEQLIVKGGRSI